MSSPMRQAAAGYVAVALEAGVAPQEALRIVAAAPAAAGGGPG